MPNLPSSPNFASQPSNGLPLLWEGPNGQGTKPVIDYIQQALIDIYAHLDRTNTINGYGGGITSGEIANDAVLSRNLAPLEGRIQWSGGGYAITNLPSLQEREFKDNTTINASDFAITTDFDNAKIRFDFQWAHTLSVLPSGVPAIPLIFKLKRSTSSNMSGAADVPHSFVDAGVPQVCYPSSNGGTHTNRITWYDDVVKPAGTYYYCVSIMLNLASLAGGTVGDILVSRSVLNYLVT